MKMNSYTRFLPAVASLALFGSLPSALAQDNDPDLFHQDIDKAFKEQMERFSRLFESDPETKKQFEKGLNDMLRAMEDGSAKPGEPQRFEFRYESDPSGLDLDNFDDLFLRGGDPFGGLIPGRGFAPDGGMFRQLQEMLEHGGGFSFAPFVPEPLEVPELSKNHADELAKFRSVVSEARESTVLFLSGGNQIALGTIITKDGYALTKYSEFARRGTVFEAELSDGSLCSAFMIERIPEYDLALVKLDADGLKPASFGDSNLPVGSFLAAPGIHEDPVAVGVVSVLPRNLSDKRKGYLGIEISKVENGARVRRIGRGSAAHRAGLAPGDIITAVEGKKVGSPSQLIRAISGESPEAEVELSFVRDGQEQTTTAQLRSREDIPKTFRDSSLGALDLTSRLGADVSRHRDGYPTALQHDLPLNAHEIGGPLVNLDGEVIGINIARAGRVSTYALPAGAVRDIIADLDLDDHPAAPPAPDLPTTDPADPLAREELEDAEREIERAHEALRQAENRARNARQKLVQESLNR
jgi:S1-C subfamily serine protease